MKFQEFMNSEENKMNKFSIDFKLAESPERDYEFLEKIFSKNSKVIQSSVTSKWFMTSSLTIDEVINHIQNSGCIISEDKIIITDIKNKKIKYIGIIDKNAIRFMAEFA